MSYRTTVVLLAVLIILAGAVYYLQKQPTAAEVAQKQKTPQIVTFASTDATKLVVSGTDKTTSIVKSGATWNLELPQPGPADNGRVNGWADQLGQLTADRVIDEASDLGGYGLAQPKFSVEVDLQGGKTVKLAFGDKTPDGSDYYVRFPDDQTKAKSVYLVNAPLGDDLSSALTKPPQALPTPTALPTLVPGPTSAVTPAATPLASPTP
jgi:Domain of unknown function (DUF4340)